MGTKPLAGMSALVTGGGGGIAEAAAVLLARDGAAVVMTGRTEKTLLEARDRVLETASGGNAKTISRRNWSAPPGAWRGDFARQRKSST